MIKILLKAIITFVILFVWVIAITGIFVITHNIKIIHEITVSSIKDFMVFWNIHNNVIFKD